MWKYFTRSEFACRHCGLNRIDLDFVTKLDQLRGAYGSPLIVSSGYRCPEHNQKVSSTGPNGPHTTGLAVDFRVDRENAVDLLEIALTMDFRGIGIQQKGEGRFIHLDSVPRPTRTIWSY